MADCRICINREESPVCSDCKDGSNFEKEIFTNADKIRAMSDEELAEFFDSELFNIAESFPCEHCENQFNCDICYLQWLQSEAE